MSGKALSRVLMALLCAATLPACLNNSSPRFPNPQETRVREPLSQIQGREPAPAEAARRREYGPPPYPYATVTPHRKIAAPLADAVRPERIIDPPPEMQAPRPLPREPVFVEDPVTPAQKTLEPVVPQPPPDRQPTLPVTAAPADEPRLVTALRCFYDKRSDDGVHALRGLDAASQEALLTLLPMTVRFSEINVSQADAHEVAIMVDQLQSLLVRLQPRAEIRIDKLCFCKSIRKFGVFEPMEPKPIFRPGEMVDVYCEVHNVSCEEFRTRNGEYRTRTTSALEIRENGGNAGWRKDIGKVDHRHTPVFDDYHHYRFQLPDLNPGPYALSVEVVDVPTGRKTKQKVEFRVIH